MNGADGVGGVYAALLITEYLALGFTVLYAVANSILILIGYRPAREDVRALAYHDLDMMDDDMNAPPVAVLVPAYNESAGIVDSVSTFLELDYPRVEIVVVNDGSKDDTMEVLRKAFRLRLRDVTYHGGLDTAEVRGVYEAGVPLPDNIQRLIIVDKANGGRADALNCALNISRSPYFVTVDADSILDPQSMKLIMREFQSDTDVDAVGGQIGIVNDAVIERGRIASVGIPRSLLPLCQTLEYVRSFTTARTGWTRLGCLLILSGAFLVTRRQTALDIGGFLTGRVRSRLLEEYSGAGVGTIGEDMEMIVRLHRYKRETGRVAKIVHTPLPVCWTEVPSTWRVLGRQRRRWHRGLMEILRYHRRMLLNPAYGRVGLVAFPYVVLFEFLGPYLEAMGYLLLPVVVALGILDAPRALLLAGVALGFGVLHSLVAVMCATWMEPVGPARTRMRSLLGMDRWRDRALLILGCALGEMGYRQTTVFWRLHGTWEYLRGIDAWGDMERKGFKKGAAAAALALALLLAPTATAAPETREVSLVGGIEHREGAAPGTWAEARHRWGWARGADRRIVGVTAGFYTIDRAAGQDGGVLAGLETKLGSTAGAGLELRAAPGAMASARWSVRLEGEALVRAPVSGSWTVVRSAFRDAAVTELSPGAVVYLPRDAWTSLRVMHVRTVFDAGSADALWGAAATLHVPWRGAEWRLRGSVGGESYLAGTLRAPGQIRARAVGAWCRVPWGRGWAAEGGVSVRDPERGSGDLYLHGGLRRRW
ncbi:MAG: glycosyltransferase [Gemmatimonadetes bacterium]|nr:glycosyltransferase [Gemmatimonadota bacterium]